MLAVAKNFSCQSLQAVSIDGVSKRPAYRDAESAFADVVFGDVKIEYRTAHPGAVIEDGLELAVFTEPLRFFNRKREFFPMHYRAHRFVLCCVRIAEKFLILPSRPAR